MKLMMIAAGERYVQIGNLPAKTALLQCQRKRLFGLMLIPRQDIPDRNR